MRIKRLLFSLLFFSAIFIYSRTDAQVNQYGNGNNGNYQLDNQGRPIRPQQQGSDSLKLRNKYEDSITITYKYFDSSIIHHMDSAINDFNTRLQLPYTYNNLGNIGSPAEPLLFTPYMQPGFDAGFHAMDPYKFNISDTRYYTTTRPYSVLGYMLGSKGEQYIDVLHTQPRDKGRVNFTFEYRLLNAPGEFKNQNTANSNLRANISYQSDNKRYSTNFIFIRNSLKAATNGGLVNPGDLDNIALGTPFSVSTRLGSGNFTSSNPFNASVTTGNIYKDVTLYLRQSYDFGQKDSIVKDTVVYHLFYPRLRLEHTIKYSNNNYSYVDYNPIAADYLNYFNFIAPSDSISYHDNWKDLNNEFALYTYPDKKNTNQFLKLYADFQTLKGTLGKNYIQSYNNIYIGAEYRNRTRNQKWDMDAWGKLYVAGNYGGNYTANISLRRDFGNKLGSLQIGFENVNRTPSYIFNSATGNTFDTSHSGANTNFQPHSDFPVIGVGNFKNENISKAYALFYLPELRLKLSGNYYLFSNYTYFTDYFTATQSNTVFNLLQISAEKEFKLGKYFHWYIDGNLQQKTGNVPLHVPLLLMRSRIAFEGNFFKNLYLATGIEARYLSPFKADIYSPFTGQFFYQNDETISNRPDLALYVNFRITRFKLFAELSNLNTLNYNSKSGSFGFNHYSFLAPNYPNVALWLRLGVWWTFIN